MRFNIKLSDKIIEINSIYQDVYDLCRDYLYAVPDRAGDMDSYYDGSEQDGEDSGHRKNEPVGQDYGDNGFEQNGGDFGHRKNEPVGRDYGDDHSEQNDGSCSNKQNDYWGRKPCESQVKPDITVTITQADIDFERSRDAEAEHATDGYLETLAVYRSIAEQMLDFDTILMHGSVIGVGDRAFMFTAASGVGKTTRTQWWLQQVPDSYIINGDKPLLHIADSQVIACGTPWSGKENLNADRSAALQAIILLERLEGKQPENIPEGSRDNPYSLQKISFLEAFTMLLQQTYRPASPILMSKTLNLLKKIGQNVPVYRYCCSLEDTDMIKIYKTVAGETG